MTEKQVIETARNFDADVTDILRRRGMRKKDLANELGISQNDINEATVKFAVTKSAINTRKMIRNFLGMNQEA